jgi:type II secretory pathway component PulJ
MAAMTQQAHMKALQSVNTLMEARIAAAVDVAVNKTKGLMAGDKIVDALHTALPFTKDKSIGPVAQTVMQRFIDRGLSTEDSIKGVKKWFDKAITLADPNYKKPNTNLNGGYRGTPSENTSETNWLDLLSPNNKS